MNKRLQNYVTIMHPDVESAPRKPSTFYILSVVLASLAFFFQIIARAEMEQGSRIHANHISAAVEKHVKIGADAEASRHYAVERTFRNIGFLLTSLGIMSILVALQREERGWYLILTGFLLVGLFTPMLL